MSAHPTRYGKYKGVYVYRSANTHRGAKTRQLMVYTNPGYTGYRFIVGDCKSELSAYMKCQDLIDGIKLIEKTL